MNLAVARIRAAIKHKSMTQKEVAARMGISEQYLSDICTSRTRISAFMAVRLERVLGMDAAKLLYDQVIDELRQAREELGA